MRFGLVSPEKEGPQERKVSADLRKKLQFLELKAFEQSGQIKELLGEIEKKTDKS